MNIRRNFFHVLLSLLLVFSQQMGYSHALSHASAATAAVQAAVQAAEPADDEVSTGITKLGLDHSCAQCMAFAQIASAVDSRFHSFPLAFNSSVAVAFAPAPLDCQRTICGFRSRAPPVLS